MTAKQRWDSYRIKAAVDSNGYLIDTPIVARIGLQVYYLPDGTERREFRPASEVFNGDSMATYVGKPITVGHVNVNSENAKEVAVGSTTGHPYRVWDDVEGGEGVGLACPLSIFDKNAVTKAMSKIASEISVGYTSIDIERPGWGNELTGEYFFKDDENATQKFDEMNQSEGWVEFDALQTTIRVNHIALVFRGRAGVAKLNLDSVQEFPYDYHEPEQSQKGKVMTVKIKFDGIDAEFEVDAEVAKQINSLKSLVVSTQVKADGFEHQVGELKAKVDSFPDLLKSELEKSKSDGEAFAALVKLATEAGVKTDGLDGKAIKIAFIKETTGRDVSQKEDAYIDTAFDFAKDGDNMASQRISAAGKTSPGDIKVDAAQDVAIPNPQARFRK
ncbi:putative capsid and scaffold protein [Erwinia phage Snitter]|nr:putative capsid and scaffold protein [Erwinia phage Snitter]